MEFEELSKIIKSGKVVGTNSSSTSLELADPAPSYENFRNTIYQYPSIPHRSWTDYPSGPGISKRRRPVPGVSRFVNSVRKLRKDSSSRLTKPFEEVMSSEDDVSDSDRNYKLSSAFNDASDISFNTALMMDGPPKDQYIPLSKPKFSRSSSKSSIIATSAADIREQKLQRPDRLRGLRSKSHNSIRDGRPPRIWRKKLTSSPKNAGSALGIQFNDTLTEVDGMGFNQAPDQHETMINIRAAMNNMSNILGHHTLSSPVAAQETADKLPSDYLVHELVERIEYLRGRMSFEEEKIKKSKDEIKFYIENLKMLDEKVEQLNAGIAAARTTAIPGMEQQLAETGQRNPNLKRSRNVHIKTVKSIDQQNRRMKDYPSKLIELERQIQAARRRETASMLMDKWGTPIVVVLLSILLAFAFNS